MGYEYEYKIEEAMTLGAISEDRMNSLGKQGWMLINVVYDGSRAYFYFVRQVEEDYEDDYYK